MRGAGEIAANGKVRNSGVGTRTRIMFKIFCTNYLVIVIHDVFFMILTIVKLLVGRNESTCCKLYLLLYVCWWLRLLSSFVFLALFSAPQFGGRNKSPGSSSLRCKISKIETIHAPNFRFRSQFPDRKRKYRKYNTVAKRQFTNGAKKHEILEKLKK